MVQAGLEIATIATGKDAQALTGLANLHPMQIETESAVLPDGPVLVLIEDATGAGKTESALILAHRMIASSRARGLFFALPTMATANAMFVRMTSTASRLFAVPPSLTLSMAGPGCTRDFAPLSAWEGMRHQRPTAPLGLPMTGDGPCWRKWASEQSTRRSWVSCPPASQHCGCLGWPTGF